MVQTMNARLLAGALDFPTSVALDSKGGVYVAESGLPFGGGPAGGRIWVLGPDGSRKPLASGLRSPVTGLTHHDGSLYVSEGGAPGRISRLNPKTGALTTILDDLPGGGNYHTNMAVAGPDDCLYFGQGAMTNGAVVGLDGFQLGWLRRVPHAYDVPGLDITLSGATFVTPDPRHPGTTATTGAFADFGTVRAGRQVRAGLPCTAAVMRCRLDGGELELVAWGLRNAYGLGFLDDGTLLAVDQGADERGSRPIGNAPDLLFAVRKDAWYGWPDFVGGEPVTAPQYAPQAGPAPGFVLAEHHRLPKPETPLYRFAPHTAATRFCQDGRDLYVTLFGDERPMTAPAGEPDGRAIVRLAMDGWTEHQVQGPPLQRPIDIVLDRQAGGLYVLDFGCFEMDAEKGVVAQPGTGALWRID